jgi:Ran GTPase-activating protein 1
MGQVAPFNSDDRLESTDGEGQVSNKTLKLLNYLTEKQNSTKISFSETKYDANHGKLIAEWLKKNTNLQYLHLGQNAIEDEGLRHISFCFAFNKNQTLKILDLTDSTIGPNVSAPLSSCISLNTTITELNLTNTKLSSETLKHLCPSFEKTKTLLELNLSKNNLKEESIKCISSFLSKNESIQILNLNENQLGSKADHLSSFLEMNQHLKTMLLQNNDLTLEDLKFISQGLEKNKVLKKLDLSFNKISQEGAQLLSNCLLKNVTLEELDLSNNLIKNEGCKCISNSLLKNQGLTCLNISANCIEKVECFKELFGNNESLKQVNLSENNVDNDGCKILMEGLSLNRNLILLDVSKNHSKIDETLIKQMAEQLNKNKINL